MENNYLENNKSNIISIFAWMCIHFGTIIPGINLIMLLVFLKKKQSNPTVRNAVIVSSILNVGLLIFILIVDRLIEYYTS
jgi:hypothetical protein